jgi:hypothetical protein
MASLAIQKRKSCESVTCVPPARRYNPVMPEPKFSDAFCYGKEFDATSRICRVCLANKSCQRKSYKLMGVSMANGPSIMARPKRAKFAEQTAFS